MDPLEFRSKLPGVISFPVTVFKKDLSLDLDGYRQNLERLVDHPLSVIAAPGGTGEVFSLNSDEYSAMVRATVEGVGGRIPVMAGVAFNLPMAVEMAKEATALGVDGILAFPPYYPNADFGGLYAYYRAIAEATPLGIFIYSRDWARFSPEQVEKLTEIPNLVAWKDGQGDIRAYQMIKDRVGDRLHWIGGAGDDLVPGYYSIGVRTYTSSIACVSPKLSLALHECAAAGEGEELGRLMREYVVPLYAFRTRKRGYEVSVMKSMMDIQGQVGGPVRPPLVDVSSGEVEELKLMLENWEAFL